MKFLFLDAYFEPENTAYTHLEKDILIGLIKNGNTIEVVCPVPSRGISQDVKKQYRNNIEETLYDGKLHVQRFKVYSENKNAFFRAIRYFYCAFRSFQIAEKMKDVNIIFSNSTPPIQGLLCGKVAKKLSKRYNKKVPFIYNLQDIFPDSLVTTGLSRKNSLLFRLGSRIEKKTYQNADKIIVISNAMKKNILDKGVPEDKIKVIPNWIDTKKIIPVLRINNRLFDEFNIPRTKFIVLYAGNLGAAQGTDVIIEAAQQLQDKPDIQFVIFGNGVDYNLIKNKILNNNIKNVFLHKLLPQERVSEVYSMGDVDIITCKKDTGKSSMPSKLWSIMACNTEIIASFDTDSELAEVLKDANAGCCVEPQNANALGAAILKAYDRWKNGNKISVGSREYVNRHASKERCIAEYIKLFKEVAGNNLD